MSEPREVRVELRRLSAYGAHGVSPAEREVGRRIELDVSFLVPGAHAPETDELSGTVDYGAVAELAATIVGERSFKTLERLCAVIADEIAARFEVAAIEVRAAKPEPPIPQSIGEVAVTLREPR